MKNIIEKYFIQTPKIIYDIYLYFGTHYNKFSLGLINNIINYFKNTTALNVDTILNILKNKFS